MDDALTSIKNKLKEVFPELPAKEIAIAAALHRARAHTLKMDNTQYEKRIFERELGTWKTDGNEKAGFLFYQNTDIAHLLSALKQDAQTCLTVLSEIYAHQAVGKRKARLLAAVGKEALDGESAKAFACLCSENFQKQDQKEEDGVFTSVRSFISFAYPKLRLLETVDQALDSELLSFCGNSLPVIERSDAEIKRDLEEIKTGKYPSDINHGVVFIGKTSLPLEQVGFERLSIVATRIHLENIMRSQDEKMIPASRYEKERNPHGLSPDMVIRAVRALEDPICIFQSEKLPQRIVSVTDVRDNAGKLIIIPMEPNGKIKQKIDNKKLSFDVNFATSLYGKTVEKEIEKAIQSDRVLYVNKKKSRACLASTVQFRGSEGIDVLFYKENIARYIGSVNTFINEFNENNHRSPRLTGFGRNVVYDAFPRMGQGDAPAIADPGALDIIGKPLHMENSRISEQGWAELTGLLSVYSDKNYETSRYLLIKGNVIRDHIAISSRHPLASVSAPGQEFLEELQKSTQKEGMQVVFVHNHPSGYVSPSHADKTTTEGLHELFEDKFAGHIILDHGTYGLYNAEEKEWAVLEDDRLMPLTEYEEKEKAAREGAGVTPDKAIEVRGKIGLLELAEYAKQVDAGKKWDTGHWVPCCFTDAHNRLTHIHYIQKDAFMRGDRAYIEQSLKKAALMEKSNQVYLIANEFDPDLFSAMEQFAADTGMIKDIYHRKPDGYETSVFDNGAIFSDEEIRVSEAEDTRFYGEGIKKRGKEGLIMGFFDECKDIEDASEYGKKYEGLEAQCTKGVIRFPSHDTVTLTIEGEKKPAFSGELTPGNLSKLYRFAVKHNVLLENMVPDADTFKEFHERIGGKELIKQWKDDLINRQDEGYHRRAQGSYFNNFDDNFELLSGVNMAEIIEKEKGRGTGMGMDEGEIVRRFAERPDAVGARVPAFGVLSENGVNYDIISDAVYLGRKQKEVDIAGKKTKLILNEQTVYLGRVDKEGKLAKIAVSEGLYNTMIKAAKDRAKAPELTAEVLAKYREEMRIHENDTRANLAENFWHNYRALCRTQANNKQDAFKIADAIIREMPLGEKNKLFHHFKKYEKLAGKAYKERLSEYYEKAVHNIPVVNKTPFSNGTLAWDVRSHIEVAGREGERIAAGIKTAVGDVIKMKLSYTDPFTNDIGRIEEPLKITCFCRENNTVVLMDSSGSSKYTLPYDKFVSQMKSLEAGQERRQGEGRGIGNAPVKRIGPQQR